MSTLHVLVEFLIEITNLLDNKKCASVFIDLKKAFDTVDHQLLCKKLEYYSICGIAYNWISDYLANHIQNVIVPCTGL